jgi:hypothetical protein
MELIGTGPDQRSLAVLYDAAQQDAVALRFSILELPCFTLWKNTAALRDGYVTGLEPGNSFPNFRTLEREQGRLKDLAPGETAAFGLEIEIRDQAAGVGELLEEIRLLQAEQGRVGP